LREQAAQSIAEHNERLESTGYHLQVTRTRDYSNLFHCDGKRTRIDFAEGGFDIDGAHFTQKALEAKLSGNPELFAPNVFLRPIVQSHIFPTLIYFAGPAEAAYFAQMAGLYEMFSEVPPIIYPRYSATVIEHNVLRLMQKYELGFEDVLGDAGQVLNNVIRRTFPADFDHLFDELRLELGNRLATIRAALDQSDHGLVTNANRIAGRIDLEIKSLEDKIFQAHRKKNQTVRGQLDRIAFQLFPERQLQERAFPLNYYVAKYGWWIVERLYSAVNCASGAHHLVYLDQPEKEDE
jgi:bacillithiol synthase